MGTVRGHRAQEPSPPCRPVGQVVGLLGRPQHTALLWCVWEDRGGGGGGHCQMGRVWRA